MYSVRAKLGRRRNTARDRSPLWWRIREFSVKHVEVLVPPTRLRHGSNPPTVDSPAPKQGPLTGSMNRPTAGMQYQFVHISINDALCPLEEAPSTMFQGAVLTEVRVPTARRAASRPVGKRPIAHHLFPNSRD